MPVEPSTQDKPADQPENQAGAADHTTEGATTAGSPAAGDKTTDAKNEPSSLLEAVQAASKKVGEGASSSTGDGDGSVTKADKPADGAEAPKDGEKAKGEDDQPPPFHQHPRWQQMLKRVKDAEDKTKVFEQSHQSLQQLHGYMAEANLTPEEVNKGFAIMALMKNDPAKALETLLPYVEGLQLATGKALPSDLKEKVDQGFIDEAHAQELAMLRTREQMNAEAARTAGERNARTHVNNVVQTISRWEQQWQGSDPDYSRKQPRVQEKIELALRRNGMPATEAAVIKLADDARKAVEDELKAILPQRQPVKTVNAGGASVAARPEPKSMLEAITLAARGAA